MAPVFDNATSLGYERTDIRVRSNVWVLTVLDSQ
jgi:hypothetical protein